MKEFSSDYAKNLRETVTRVNSSGNRLDALEDPKK